MSRILVFDKENDQIGELHAVVTRGWAISDGGSASFTLSNIEAEKPWLQFGRMVFIDGGNKLPNWAGFIDTPWKATSPVSVTAYDVPYILSRKNVWKNGVLNGDTRELVLSLLREANQLEENFIREGNIDTDDEDHALEITATPYWDQIKELMLKSGYELMFRSVKNNDNKLWHYLDIQQKVGVNTQLVLQDGQNGNMNIDNATLDGEFWNQVMGFNNSSAENSRLYSEIYTDDDSVALYGVRNKAVQFETESQSMLEKYTKKFLAENGNPWLALEVSVRDVEGVFSNIRLGNSVSVRATKLFLPGGKKGWVGRARIMAMTYKEQTNQITLSLKGTL